VGNGALGISSETCATGRKAPCIATNAPPAEMLSAVANSRRSLPFESRLRTKRGIGKGSRVQARRSIFGEERSKQLTFPTEVLCLPHLGCQTNATCSGGHGYNEWYFRDLRAKKAYLPGITGYLPDLSGHNTIFCQADFGKSLPKTGKCFAFFVDTPSLVP